MKERDYLWCLVHQLLDGEEALDRLCPSCRMGAMEHHCHRCGTAMGDWGEGAANAAFDQEHFVQLQGGGIS